MTQLKSREVRLASRPKGIPVMENFIVETVAVEPLQQGMALVRNLYMSVDPYMRGRMNEGRSYVPPFELGKALDGGAVGEVIESKAEDLATGDIVVSSFGWREYFNGPASQLRKVRNDIQPLSVYLGILGMTGMTAWVGLQIGELKAGETIYISGAAGAVGSAAGQLAKIYGCRAIGSAGSSEKVSFIKEECSFDAAFNYKAGAIRKQLSALAPDGIDVYFDNVGGDALEAALAALKVHGRIIACGGISVYNAERPQPGPSNLFSIITKRLTMKGFIVMDWMERQGEFHDEVGRYYRAGTVKNKETVVEGIEQAASAFIGLFEGNNTGKMVVKLS